MLTVHHFWSAYHQGGELIGCRRPGFFSFQVSIVSTQAGPVLLQDGVASLAALLPQKAHEAGPFPGRRRFLKPKVGALSYT